MTELERLKEVEQLVISYLSSVDAYSDSDGSDATIVNEALRAEDILREKVGSRSRSSA